MSSGTDAADRDVLGSLLLVGSDPIYMLTGPIPATEKILRQAGLTMADLDLVEIKGCRSHRHTSSRQPAPRPAMSGNGCGS